jgi:hypothetical protein
MATDGQFCWPPAGNFVAAYGQFFMAANRPDAESLLVRTSVICEFCEFYTRPISVIAACLRSL